MRTLLRVAFPVVAALAVAACSLGSLLGGGGKTPPWLLTLTPEAPAPAALARASNAAEAVTVNVPVISEELRTTRVPAHIGHASVQYIEDLQLVDTPDRLFQSLLSETVRRMTNRVVLDPRHSALDPGLLVSGHLHRFGFDEPTQSVIVRFDAALSTAGGTRVETRRFEASVPSAPDAGSVGTALNRAANQVAIQAAAWIGGS